MEGNRTGSFQFEIIALTHRGAIRPKNEDAVLIDKTILVDESDDPIVERFNSEFPIVVVADGMGGHAHGATASQSALRVVRGAIGATANPVTISNALAKANDELYDLMRLKPELSGMGTTIVGAVLSKATILYFNVGDSRIYHHRYGSLVLLSHDDVPLASSGPKRKRSSHLITQSLGGQKVHAKIMPHIGQMQPLQQGESLLLCSDGLTDMVDEQLIGLAMDQINEMPDLALNLFDLAMRSGGKDNISLIIVRLC